MYKFELYREAFDAGYFNDINPYPNNKLFTLYYELGKDIRLKENKFNN